LQPILSRFESFAHVSSCLSDASGKLAKRLPIRRNGAYEDRQELLFARYCAADCCAGGFRQFLEE
jgi:hypothetical protein